MPCLSSCLIIQLRPGFKAEQTLPSHWVPISVGWRQSNAQLPGSGTARRLQCPEIKWCLCLCLDMQLKCRWPSIGRRRFLVSLLTPGAASPPTFLVYHLHHLLPLVLLAKVHVGTSRGASAGGGGELAASAGLPPSLAHPAY